MISIMNTHDPRLLTDIDRMTLRRIAETAGPIGQGALCFYLQKKGFVVSTPTIGRRLQVFEHNGLVRKVGVDGRKITKRGLATLQRLDAEAQLRLSGEQLLGVLRQGDDKIILDLLFARRVIESENAALAAEAADGHAVRQLEAIIEKQQTEIDQGRLGLEFDVKFHLQIAKIANNPVLYSLTALLRKHEPYNVAVASASAILGHHSVAGHRTILKAIKAHVPESARAAMAEHLQTLMSDLRKCSRRPSIPARPRRAKRLKPVETTSAHTAARTTFRIDMAVEA